MSADAGAAVQMETNSAPNFESSFNYRKERFTPNHFPFDPEQAKKWCAIATAPGVLPGANGQASIDEDNRLVIQLFDKVHDEGLHIDGVLKVVADGVRSLTTNLHRTVAIELIDVALLLLDALAQQKHGYADSPLEASTPPSAAAILGTKQAWMDQYDVLVGLINRGK